MPDHTPPSDEPNPKTVEWAVQCVQDWILANRAPSPDPEWREAEAIEKVLYLEVLRLRAEVEGLKARLAVVNDIADGEIAEANQQRERAERAETELDAAKELAVAWKQERDKQKARDEHAEAECQEQARLNGMGAEREAALREKVEEAEKRSEGWRRMSNVAEMYTVVLQDRLDKAEKRHAESVAQVRALVYGFEGSNRWPVEWEEDYMASTMRKAKDYLASIGRSVPVWERNGPGWKRAALDSGGEV